VNSGKTLMKQVATAQQLAAVIPGTWVEKFQIVAEMT
jgi:hypothetical protein